MTEYDKKKEEEAKAYIKETLIEDLKECLKSGKIPLWEQGFRKDNKFLELRGKKPYNVCNTILLLSSWLKRKENGLEQTIPMVGTFKAWKGLNDVSEAKEDKSKTISVRKGAKGTLIVMTVPHYWVNKKMVQDEERLKELEEILKNALNDKNRQRILAPYVKSGEICLNVSLKLSNVFFLDDVENISTEYKEKLSKYCKGEGKLIVDVEENSEKYADKVVKAFTDKNDIKVINIKMGSEIFNNSFSSSPYWNRDSKEIVLPLKEQYNTLSGYYGTLFHELGHSTMVKDIERAGNKSFFGTKDYAVEEMVAEFFSCAMLNYFNMNENKGNHIAYLTSWGERICKDNNIQGQKSGDVLLKLFEDIDGKEMVYVMRKVDKALDNVFEAYRESVKDREKENGGNER